MKGQPSAGEHNNLSDRREAGAMTINLFDLDVCLGKAPEGNIASATGQTTHRETFVKARERQQRW
jgi:hypothetical protein